MLFSPAYQQLAPRRVVITGAGIISPLGLGWAANAEGFRQGRVAMRPVTLFNTRGQRVASAAEVDMPASLPPTDLSRAQRRRLDRASQMLVLATHEALSGAGWVGLEDVPLVLGTTSGGMTLGQAFYRQAIQPVASDRRQATRVVHYQAQRQALDAVEAFGIGGPVTIIANACASGANAIGHAWEMVREGRAERILTGGYEALSQLVFAGFDSLQALSPSVCRPFDARRDGLALGEGAAILALETLGHAAERGARILGEIVGYGTATDIHHLTQPSPKGEAALASMRAACVRADLEPEQIGYINAHGTGTPLNDSAEAMAINAWAGAAVTSIPVSSTKASIGHLLGAAGAVEAVVCLMVLRDHWLPPTTTIINPDPVCAFRLVRTATNAQVEYVLSNSFGFGGANATLVLRRWHE